MGFSSEEPASRKQLLLLKLLMCQRVMYEVISFRLAFFWGVGTISV